MTKPIRKSYVINASVSTVWDALVNPKTIDRWGGGKAVMSDHEGAPFSLWNGDIHGKNLKVIREKKLVQEWIAGRKWTKPSKATFTLRADRDKTRVELVHTGVPENEWDEINDGWDWYYLGELKKAVE